MNLEKEKSILDMISKLKSGEKIFIECDKMELQELCSEFSNIEVKTDLFDDGMQLVKKLKGDSPSASKEIKEILRNYKTGFIILNHSVSYARQIVSKFNKVNNDNFKVKGVKGELPSIYKDLEDREFVTQAEFDEFESSMMAKLEMLRSCIIEVDDSEIMEVEFEDEVGDDDVNVIDEQNDLI